VGLNVVPQFRILANHQDITAKIRERLDIALPHTDQASESDMNLLHRLAKRYDAIAKPAGGHLLFLRGGDAQSVTGVALV
jgi:phage protein D